MSAYDRIQSLIREIYASAADELRWPATLQQLADEFGGAVGGFQLRTGEEGRVRWARFAGVDPATREELRTYWATRNTWVTRTQPLFRPGLVLALHHVVPPAELRRTEYYDGVLRPFGVLHGFGACVSKRGSDIMSFSVLRSRAKSPYEASELVRVRALLPHLARALQVNERLSQLSRAHGAFTDGLEQLRHGVVVVDRLGRVVFANRMARTIAAQRDGLAVTRDGLVASSLSERTRLRTLIDGAVCTARGEGIGSGGAMRVTRPSLKRPFLAVVAPLSFALDHGQPSGLATVFLSDPEANAEPADDLLRELYGLTATETRVARAFAATGSLERVAAHLRISRDTVRWHLRSLYRKTGTHRQAALLERLVDGPARIVVNPAREEAAEPRLCRARHGRDR
jgi:DNA-binding CsgD family transcriptional regulator